MKFNWGTGIVLFFAIFLSLAAVFIVFSFQHNTDLVVDDYYEQGAHYDVQMKIDKRSRIYADSISAADKGSFVEILMTPQTALNASEVEVWMYYASDKRNDLKAFMTEGSLKIDKKDLAKGRYQVKVSWKMQDQDYEVKTDVFVE